MLSQKVAIITGSSSGIGRATAVEFAKNGAYLSLGGRNNDRLEETKKLCIEAGADSNMILLNVGDLCSQEYLDEIVHETIKKFGKLDILVNNAGVVLRGTAVTAPTSQLDKLMDINVKAVISLSQLCVPYLIKSQGSIINVSSVAGTTSKSVWFDAEEILGSSSTNAQHFQRRPTLEERSAEQLLTPENHIVENDAEVLESWKTIPTQPRVEVNMVGSESNMIIRVSTTFDVHIKKCKMSSRNKRTKNDDDDFTLKIKAPKISAQQIAITQKFALSPPYYCMSKAALNCYTKCLALELAHRQVRVNAICPTLTATPIIAEVAGNKDIDKFLEASAQVHPLKRVAQPEEMAKPIVFLASDQASFITGQALIIDGARTLVVPTPNIL